MEKTRVVFSRNKDRKTCNMFIDDVLIDEDIPYVPSKATDHRGNALYFLCKKEGIKWEDLELDEYTERPSEVKRGWDYMFRPDLIRAAIRESNYQRRML